MSRTLTASCKPLAVALRTAAYALLLCAALPLQVAATATGSAKFIPTFAVYYGGSPALVAADAPLLAKFDLIDTDRFRYYEMSPNTWAAIKAINPNSQIYLYEMGSEAPSYLDGTAQVFLNGLGRYDVSRGHPMGSLNGDHPELFLLDPLGNRIYNVPYSNPAANQYWHLMDFGAAAYQAYWLTAVKADIVDQPWVADGVFADSCIALNFGPYTAVPAKYPDTAAWNVAMMSHTQLAEGQAGTDNWGKAVTFWQILWYSLGSFLLTKNDDLGNAYFMFQGFAGSSKFWWFDEYDKIDLGKATMTRRIDQTSPSITYTAGWVQDGSSRPWSGGTAAYSSTAGTQATFTFTGTSVSWIGARGPQTGIARVVLDGVLVAEVDTYKTTEEIQANVYSATGLAAGNHTLTIEVTGLKSAASTATYIVVDAFDVTQ